MAGKRRKVTKADQPIADNEQVKELLAILKENNSPSYKEFSQLIGQVSEMEQHLSEALNELKVMRQEMQEVKSHPLKAVLQKSYRALERNVVALRQRLSDLKGQIVEGCKNILTDFKERGAVVLNGITRFLHLKPALKAVQSATLNSIHASDQAISRIDAFSTEYHKVGQHLKNMGRFLLGKPMETEARENGKVAGAIIMVIRAKRSCISAMKGSTEKALNNLEKLEKTAQNRTSVIKNMKEQKVKIESPNEKNTPAKVQPER